MENRTPNRKSFTNVSCVIRYIEGYGRDAFASICRKIGKEDTSSVVALEEFFDARIPEIQKKLLGWIEEVGGNDFE